MAPRVPPRNRKTAATALALRRRLAATRLLALDLDGVLTDGGIYFADSGEELRKFNAKDGLGLKLVMARGVAVAVITSSTAPAIGHRCRRLGIAHLALGVVDKLTALRDVCAALRIGLDAVAYCADDINDLPVLAAVGLPIAVGDAMPEVKAAARLVTQRAGGAGAVREVCELLLAARPADPNKRRPPRLQ